MLHERGAAEIVAVEANPRAFLKCLCVKELLALDRARFLLGDALEYLRSCDEHYDVALASGLLYHMREPYELLRHLARVADAVFLWTHYYDEDRLRLRPRKHAEFDPPRDVQVDGKSYEMATCHYGRQRLSILGLPRRGVRYTGFCGGSNPTAEWLTRASLTQAVEDAGLRVERIGFDEPDHEQGPALALIARNDRRSGS
jgi:SAM-dependent methyltransferase